MYFKIFHVRVKRMVNNISRPKSTISSTLKNSLRGVSDDYKGRRCALQACLRAPGIQDGRNIEG